MSQDDNNGLSPQTIGHPIKCYWSLVSKNVLYDCPNWPVQSKLNYLSYQWVLFYLYKLLFSYRPHLSPLTRGSAMYSLIKTHSLLPCWLTPIHSLSPVFDSFPYPLSSWTHQSPFGWELDLSMLCEDSKVPNRCCFLFLVCPCVLASEFVLENVSHNCPIEDMISIYFRETIHKTERHQKYL